jgi:hypothetical protein
MIFSIEFPTAKMDWVAAFRRRWGKPRRHRKDRGFREETKFCPLGASGLREDGVFQPTFKTSAAAVSPAAQPVNRL